MRGDIFLHIFKVALYRTAFCCPRRNFEQNARFLHALPASRISTPIYERNLSKPRSQTTDTGKVVTSPSVPPCSMQTSVKFLDLAILQDMSHKLGYLAVCDIFFAVSSSVVRFSLHGQYEKLRKTVEGSIHVGRQTVPDVGYVTTKTSSGLVWKPEIKSLSNSGSSMIAAESLSPKM